MIPAEVIQKIRRLQITTSRQVTEVFAGHYRSVFRGKGMEFEEVREYAPGDDVRSIDWNVTARTGRLYVKRFAEERELTVMLLLDLSPSLCFGTVRQLKSQLAARLCGLLSFCAIRNNDRIGLILFTDQVEKFVPPEKGLGHVLRILKEALYFSPRGKGTNISAPLEYLNRVLKRRTVTFILSDFHASHFERALSVARRRHDLVAITFTDPFELTLPRIGIVKLDDPETGQSFLIDTSDELLRNEYRKNARERAEERKRLFRSSHVDHIDLRTDAPYLPVLIKFFRMRERRYGR